MENSIVTISYKIKGMIDREHITEFFEQMTVIAKEGRKINLVFEVDSIHALRKLNQFFSDEKTKNRVLDSLTKFALIADTDWIEELGDFIEYLIQVSEVEIFGLHERKEANRWVQAPTKIEDRDLKERVKQGYAHLIH